VAYTIEWHKQGAVKEFTGTVSLDDVTKSERDITRNSKYMELSYVVSNFLDAHHPHMTESECQHVSAAQLGGFYSNPRIKFAIVTVDVNVKNVIEKNISDGLTLHATRVFATFEAAMAWATVLC
jgi:hypothetical protein